jgi:hypothetical protein
LRHAGVGHLEVEKIGQFALQVHLGSGAVLFLDFLTFCSVHPAQALLNSTPQLLTRDRRAVA